MMKFAEVAVALPVDRTFHYSIPDKFSNEVAIGKRVFVPFQARSLVVNQLLTPAASAKTTVTSIATVASPLRLTVTPPVLRRAPPVLGEHTDEVLAELGLGVAAIAALRAQGTL